MGLFDFFDVVCDAAQDEIYNTEIEICIEN